MSLSSTNQKILTFNYLAGAATSEQNGLSDYELHSNRINSFMQFPDCYLATSYLLVTGSSGLLGQTHIDFTTLSNCIL